MNKRKYCCDASQKAYEKYYMNQVGSGLPVYVGSRGQKGHGLGSMLSGLFRSALPMVKQGLSTIGKSALKTGLSIAGDVLEGKNAGDAAKARVAQTIKRFADDDGVITDSEQPTVRRSAQIERKVDRHRQRKRNKRRKIDIFD